MPQADKWFGGFSFSPVSNLEDPVTAAFIPREFRSFGGILVVTRNPGDGSSISSTRLLISWGGLLQTLPEVVQSVVGVLRGDLVDHPKDEKEAGLLGQAPGSANRTEHRQAFFLGDVPTEAGPISVPARRWRGALGDFLEFGVDPAVPVMLLHRMTACLMARAYVVGSLVET